jgi:hypothetical protein
MIFILVVDGIQFKVVGPAARRPKALGSGLRAQRKLTWGNADIMTAFGLPEYLFTFNGAFGYVSPYGLFASVGVNIAMLSHLIS